MGKKGTGKIPVSKQVWQWTECTAPEEITEEHVRTAYRLKLGKCTNCRKNCSGNPLCLRGLGESLWLREANHQNSLQADIDDLECGIRKDGDFVGLRNLGATCYVNTFLQLWFHNLNFRKAVYKFTEEGSDQYGSTTSPQTVCGHLQLIFGMLQLSARKNIDPTPLVTSLGLDTGLQQDAQEFSKLFLSLLEGTSGVGELLCQQFCGEYDYCTKCHTCGHVSKRPSKFYELDLSIQGHKDVTQCLGEFFKEEQLDAENQYHCDSCGCKRDASRRIDIKSLPRTLNLQLLRFVFDKTTWNKKKLSNFIAFPDTLDMSPYITSGKIPPEDKVYELTAVLIHRGPSASSGHYIAHIKDDTTQLWHKFNDESIVEMKGGKKLDLDAATEDSFETDIAPKPAKKPRLKKNTHSSKNAYMLVYTKKKVVPPDEQPVIPEVPASVKKVVDEDNNSFNSCLDSVKADAKKKAEEDLKRHDTMGKMLKAMHEMDTAELLTCCRWVPQTWLKQMLDPAKQEFEHFASDKFLCAHKKLNLDRVGGMKCIPACFADHLFSMCKEKSPHLGNDLLCHQCVKDNCSMMRLKAALKEDHALVTALLKDSKGDSGEFYVGRSTLRYWKTITLNSVETKSDKNMHNTDKANGSAGVAKNSQDSETEEELDFNEDLLCEHGNLTTDDSCLRAVPAVAWEILKKYFPDASEYPVACCFPCPVCTVNDQDDLQSAELKKMVVHEQKNILASLLHNKNRPNYQDIYDVVKTPEERQQQPCFYVVPGSFVQRWREHIRNSSKTDPVSDVSNKTLLCPHGKLICDPVLCFSDSTVNLKKDPSVEEADPNTVLLWPREWNYISKNFVVDTTISITRQVPKNEAGPAQMKTKLNEQSKSSDVITLAENGSTPTAYITCNGVNNKPEDIAKAEKHTKHVDGDACSKEVKVSITSGTSCNENGTASKISLKYEPEMCMECIEGKKLEKERNMRNYENAAIYVRKVVLDGDAKSDPDSYFSKSSVQTLSSTRRSRRTHMTRGEKKITVSSDWSLKQLKIKIMSLFSIPPFDQNIWLDSERLLDDDATLGHLSVFPNCTLSVVADEPDETSLEMLPVITEKQALNLEEGFKGTSLLSH